MTQTPRFGGSKLGQQRPLLLGLAVRNQTMGPQATRRKATPSSRLSSDLHVCALTDLPTPATHKYINTCKTMSLKPLGSDGEVCV